MKRAKILLLPLQIRARLDRRLIANRFSQYCEIAEWLTKSGHPVGKSAVHRYGQRLEDRIADEGSPVETKLSGNRLAANARRAMRTLVLLVDPVSRRTRVYSSPLDARLLNERILQALGAEADPR